MKRILTFLFALAIACASFADTNLQLFYDFGSVGTACQNQRTNRVTMTVEHLSFDRFGSNFFFVDLDFGCNPNDPTESPFGAYTELARTFVFWNETKLKDLSLHLEYNGGLGIYKGGGYSINHAVLAGLEYFLHTNDYRYTFNLQLLYRHDVGLKVTVPMQFTMVWGMQDLFTCKGLSFLGYIDLYDGGRQFAFTTEPQLWYNVGQHFGCDHLHIGTEIEMSYNFCGQGFMCNPCVGLKWCF